MAKSKSSARPAESGASRRARAAEFTAQQKRAERRRTLIGVAVVAVVVVVLAGLVISQLGGSSSTPPATSSGPQILPSAVTSGQVTVQQRPATVPNTTGVPGVTAYDTKGYPASGSPDAGTLTHDHVTGPVKYAVTPPVGGPHNAIWMNAGVYTSPIPPERAVHNLEHGAVWITYRPDLPASQVSALKAFVGKQSLIDESAATRITGQESRFVDLSPWSSNALPSPIVISSWGYQLKVTSPTDPRLQQFVDTFRHSSKYSPEYGSPVDSIPVQTGGRPAAYGATKPNPAGAVPGG